MKFDTYVDVQWKICVQCGAERVFGKEAEAVAERMVGRGTPREEADAYVREGNCYLECPTPEKHKPGMPMVPLEELEHEAYYHGKCRNATVARWDAEKKRFTYMREKFGQVYPETIGYFVEAKPGEHRFDEFKPYGKMEVPPFEIKLYQN
jgi:hypothetical protein